MKIAVESRLNSEELKTQLGTGIKYVELRLRSKDLDIPIDDIRDFGRVLQNHNSKVTTIHLPEIKGEHIDLLSLDKNKGILGFIRYLAETLPTTDKVVYIVHNEYSLEELLKTNEKFKKIKQQVIDTNKQCNKLILGLENVPPLYIKGKQILQRKTRGHENRQVSNYLGSDISCVVFDTSHALSQSYLDERLLNDYSSYNKIQKSLYPLTKVVHLSNCEGLGLETEGHGLPFEEKEHLRYVMNPFLERSDITVVISNTLKDSNKSGVKAIDIAKIKRDIDSLKIGGI